MNLLVGLNKEQIEAVTSNNKHILVIAGAGSGKTRVLVSRLVYLMDEMQVSPRNILAVTFTNKASKEMKERVDALCQISPQRMWIGTFHAICLRILRMQFNEAGLKKNFVIYDQTDSINLLKRCLTELSLLDDDKKYTPQGMSTIIGDAKNRLLTPGDLTSQASSEWEENVAKVYTKYQRFLVDNNALDFDDILYNTVCLFEKHPEILDYYQNKFCHILVDEYQDTNHCQYRLIKLIAGNENNLFVVGDPDQSIYGWRGADINNILDFEKDYPDNQVIKLIQNYRSTQNILDVANSVIVNNLNRKEKDLIATCSKGEKVHFCLVPSDRDEADQVIRTIVQMTQKEYCYKDCAILYRTHSQSRSFEELCIRYGISYRIFGGLRFYDRKEVKDTLAYLRILANPDDGEALNRIYNVPRRGIGITTWSKLEDIALQQGKSIYMLLERPDILDTINLSTKNKLRALRQLFDRLQIIIAEQNVSITGLLEKLWQESGYLESLKKEEDGEERLANLEQLFDVAADFEKRYEEEAQMMLDDDETPDPPLLAFLSQLSLATDMDNEKKDNNYLTMMTLHAAKGLEFPIVFICGMEEGIFPHKRAILSDQRNEMEEERRLCYVGITRAKERLYLLAAQRRMLWGSPVYSRQSRFLEEIPEELLELSGTKSIKAQKQISDICNNVFVRTIKKDVPSTKVPQLINLGDRVLHAKFGQGVVVGISGTEEDLQVKVAFPEKGIKDLLWKYAPIKKI